MDLKFKQATPMHAIEIAQLVEKHKQAKELINFIEKYIDQATDTSEYDVVKKVVEDWKEPTHHNDGLDEDTIRLVNSKLEELEGLYHDLK